MENILKNPGLQHLAENIFLNLNHNDLDYCKLINESSFQILKNPMFWLKKFTQTFSKKNQADWTQAFKITMNGGPGPKSSKIFQKMVLERKILFYLEKCLKGKCLRMLKNEQVVDVPCYIRKNCLEKHSNVIKKVLTSPNDNESVWININNSFNKDTGKWNDSTIIDEYLEFFQLLAILTIDVDPSASAKILNYVLPDLEKVHH